MSIVKPEYRRLFAQHRFLCDEVVLVQAWKKSQRYIRRHNWYADLLELDQSAVGIETKLVDWKQQIKDFNVSPSPMHMVPAPKTHRWGFVDGCWRETEKKGGSSRYKAIHMRPLAHLGIREQTFATAAMLCLADCVETAQGDTDVTDYFEARRRRIHSYGNRLFCRYDADNTGRGRQPRPLAQFGWGNSETYRKYYVDYQRFLERPRIVAANIQDQLGRDEELYIVKLDLSSFFDLIYRPVLIERLKFEYARYVENYTLRDGAADDTFWNALDAMTAWSWVSKDDHLKKLLKPLPSDIPGKAVHRLPDGLPQGLVASGFFANAYLLDFDCCISSQLKHQIESDNKDMKLACFQGNAAGQRRAQITNPLKTASNVTIHDYCRYVDDIRLVVSIRGDGTSIEGLRKLVSGWVNHWLDTAANTGQETHRLHINEDKTEITPFRLMDGQVGVTSRMALIQGELSGPADMDALEQATTGLDALLTLANRFADCDSDAADQPDHPLAGIGNQGSEIRDDTLKRFAAGRLLRILRQRRSMTDLQLEIEPGLTQGEAIDHEMEMFARKLIRAWSHDPSLSLVLRYAMDLYPSPALLRPIIEALRGWITDDDAAGNGKPRQTVAWYLCADLFRAGAVETGMRVRDREMPANADLKASRTLLLDFAKEVLDRGSLGAKAPWYVQQQALLLFVVLEPCTALVDASRLRKPEFKRYRRLLRLASYPRLASLNEDDLVLALVNQQLHPSPERFTSWLIATLGKMQQDERLRRLKTLAFTRPDLMAMLLDRLDEQKLIWVDGDHRYLKIPKGMLHDTRELEEFDGEKVALWNLVTRPDNPFRQDVVLLINP